MSSCGNSNDIAKKVKLDNEVFASLTINDSIVDSEKDLVISVSILNSTVHHPLTIEYKL
jgi:hypothetical protein